MMTIQLEFGTSANKFVLSQKIYILDLKFIQKYNNMMREDQGQIEIN